MDKDSNNSYMEHEFKQILDKFPNAGFDSLIPILQELQQVYGFIPERSIPFISHYLGMATSRIFGVASFYDQFYFEPRGRYHIRICAGTTCHMEGSSHLCRELERLLKIKPGQVTRDGMFSLERAQCLGTCGKGPVVEIGGNYWEDVSTERLKEIIQELKNRPIKG